MLAVAALVAMPLVIGVVQNARAPGAVLAELAMPRFTSSKLDFAAAPRRALVVALQIAVLALVGAPLLAATQPFVPVLRSAVALGALLLLLVIVFWRRATDLYGHTRAGAEVIVMALAQHATGGSDAERKTLNRLHAVLPGLGEPVPVRLPDSSPALGRTLASVDLRARTGATVLAIHRDSGDTLVPTGHEALQAGDVLALAGSGEAIELARRELDAE